MKKRIHWTHCYCCGGKLFRPIDVEEGNIVKCGLCHDVPVYSRRGLVDQEIFETRLEEWK